MNQPVNHLSSTHSSAQDQLIQQLSPKVNALGYEIIHLEIQSHRQKVLRIYIDFLDPNREEGTDKAVGKTIGPRTIGPRTIGIDDCIQVSQHLDEFLDQALELHPFLQGTYELEVSSPGVDRPLRSPHDFERFSGQSARIHVYRPLTGEELENELYQGKNQKQKNFLGKLLGLQKGKVVLLISEDQKKAKKLIQKKKVTSAGIDHQEGTQIKIPLSLISKANLEPEFDLEGTTKESKDL
jgi:ribosome maturation factor RimP